MFLRIQYENVFADIILALASSFVYKGFYGVSTVIAVETPKQLRRRV
jgi:hypothetical protein